MTNEEAIKIIMEVKDNYDVNTTTNRRIHEALSTAIQALKAEPIVRCKDCSLWCICHHGDNWFCANGASINTASDFYDDKGQLLNYPMSKAEPNNCKYWDSESHFCALRKPQVEPVKHGRWKPYPIAGDCWQCSVCGILRMGSQSNYCPHCGAKMNEVEE